MNSRTFLYHTDPGHGWIEVPMTELRRLGIERAITPFSYRHGDTAYLEEDCDAPPIRRYDSYWCEAMAG